MVSAHMYTQNLFLYIFTSSSATLHCVDKPQKSYQGKTQLIKEQVEVLFTVYGTSLYAGSGLESN